MTMIVGLYDDLATAQEVVRDLENTGFDKSDLHLATYDSRAQRQESGGFFESLSNLFSGQPREVDANQGMIEQLTNWGVSHGEAQDYMEAMRRGSTLVLVNAPEDQAESAKEVMDGYDPVDIDTKSDQWRKEGWSGYDANAAPLSADQMNREREHYQAERRTMGNETRIPNVEEQMRVGKRQVQRGGVRIFRTVTEQPFEETHTLREEKVNVERRPADRPASDADLNEAFREQEYEVTETGEELVTDKRARVTGEVVVNKEVEEHPETVRDTLRRTEVHTEDLGEGQARARGNFAGSDMDADFRGNYETTYGNGGRDYSYYEPAYQYGYDMRNTGGHTGRNWNDVEADARRNWERDHPQSSWEDVKDAVRYGWEKTTGR